MKSQEQRIEGFSRDRADDMPDQEDAKTDQQNESGGAQAGAQKHLRLFSEVRPTAADDLPLRAADLRLLAADRRDQNGLAVIGAKRRLPKFVAHARHQLSLRFA